MRMRTQRVENDNRPATWSMLYPRASSHSAWKWLLAIASVAVLGVFGTGVAIWLFNKLISEQGPLFAGMVTNLVPIGAVWLSSARGYAPARVAVAVATLVAAGTTVMTAAVGSLAAAAIFLAVAPETAGQSLDQASLEQAPLAPSRNRYS